MVTWKEPKENKDLRDIIKELISKYNEVYEDDIVDIMVSIQDEYMKAQVFINEALIREEIEFITPIDFNDVEVERVLLLRLMVNMMKDNLIHIVHE